MPGCGADSVEGGRKRTGDLREGLSFEVKGAESMRGTLGIQNHKKASVAFFCPQQQTNEQPGNNLAPVGSHCHPPVSILPLLSAAPLGQSRAPTKDFQVRRSRD